MLRVGKLANWWFKGNGAGGQNFGILVWNMVTQSDFLPRGKC
jgi:hypothetical protein